MNKQELCREPKAICSCWIFKDFITENIIYMHPIVRYLRPDEIFITVFGKKFIGGMKICVRRPRNRYRRITTGCFSISSSLTINKHRTIKWNIIWHRKLNVPVEQSQFSFSRFLFHLRETNYGPMSASDFIRRVFNQPSRMNNKRNLIERNYCEPVCSL